jgi:hypothetical protein
MSDLERIANSNQTLPPSRKDANRERNDDRAVGRLPCRFDRPSGGAKLKLRAYEPSHPPAEL